MCYEFEEYYTRALIAERLRRKAEQDMQRSETPAPSKPAKADEEVKTPEPVPA